MKKQLLALALVASAGLTKAQTILWSQDFNAATPPALPAGWMQNNVDGLTVTSSLASYSFGTNAWVTRTASSIDPAWASYGRSGVSTSWYTPAGVANDWLISPQFTATAGSFLKWEAVVSDPNFADGYQVLVSNTGTAVANFTAVSTVAVENDTWTSRSISLNAYAGQSIYVAFRNNSNDKDRLLVDNIQAIIPAANDGAVISITSVQRYMAPGNATIGGVFMNNGATTATSAVMSYSIDGGAPTTQTISFTGVNYFNNANYSFTTPAALAAGPHTIQVQVMSVNGVAETNLTNDIATVIVYVATQTRPRNALIEEFTSSTCVPCANLNVNFDPLLANNAPNTASVVNVIKYQMNWPSPGTDPSYNPHGFKRRQFYNVSGIPDAFANGRTGMVAHNQAEINAAIAEPAWVDVNASLTTVGLNLAGTATITPFITVNGPVRVYQVFLQGFYNYPGATTTQKNYYHVARVMNPNGAGTPVNITAGTAFTVNFNHAANVVATPAQNSFNFWANNPTVDYEYVVFLQDTVSKHILNSGSGVMVNSTVGLVKLQKNETIGVYPNPANNAATIAVKLENATKVNLAIIDVTGKVVYSKNEEVLGAGHNEITIDTEKLSSGSYIVQVVAGDTKMNTKLIIAK